MPVSNLLNITLNLIFSRLLSVFSALLVLLILIARKKGDQEEPKGAGRK